MVLANKKILIVDDTPSIRSFVRILLDAQKAKVVEAANGHEGLAQARINSPDVIILDLGLPDIDGMEVLPRLRAEAAPNAAIIILSVRNDYNTIEKAYALGARSYINKPFLPAELLDQIKLIMDERAQSQSA